MHACFPDPTPELALPAPRAHSQHKADQLFPISEGKLLLHTDEDDISSYLHKAQTGQDTIAKYKGPLWQLLKKQVS